MNSAPVNISYVYSTHLTKKYIEGFKTEENFDDYEHLEGEPLTDEPFEDEHFEEEHFEEEHFEEEHFEEEHMEDEHFEDEHMEDEHFEDEHMEKEPMESEEAFTNFADVNAGFIYNSIAGKVKQVKKTKKCVCPKDVSETYIIIGLLLLLGFALYRKK
jgi:hypothetical protein